MASYMMEEFVGNGTLKELVPELLRAGWGDVPTLKMMNSEDMDAMSMNQQQKVAHQLRSYLHDRALMGFANNMEATEKTFDELLQLSSLVLSTQFGMTREQFVRFTDKRTLYSVLMPPWLALPARLQRTNALSISNSANGSEITSPPQSAGERKIAKGLYIKGVVYSEPAEPRLCGCIQPPPVVDKVTPYSSIENISVEKLTPEYKVGKEQLMKTKAPPMKSSELWRDKPVVLLCIRRPGCIMCRVTAHQLYARNPIFDALGVQLIAVLNEELETEVKEFWPHYWGGCTVLNRKMDFFRALGGGKLLKDNYITGFFLNTRPMANYKWAKATGLDENIRGAGDIKGGLFIVGSGNSGIAYQFIERTMGDQAPLDEVIKICIRVSENASKSGQFHQEPQYITEV